jgi:hypothetical protein
VSYVPVHVRDAWKKAHSNSAMRKQFPTKESLSGGDWSAELRHRMWDRWKPVGAKQAA